MSSHQRFDPLSRLVGTSAPKQPPPVSSPVSASPVSCEPETDTRYPVTSGGAHVTQPPANDLGTATHADSGVDAQRRDASAGKTTNGDHGQPRRSADIDDVKAVGGGARSARSAAPDSPGSPSLIATGESLDELAPMIDRARTFAERWDAPYRAEIFRVALGQLLGTRPTAATDIHPRITDAARPAGTASLTTTDAPRPSVKIAPIEKLARQLNVDVDTVERAVLFEDNGNVSILGRLDGKSRRELQINYSLVYLYVKEIALATRLIDVEELRALCVDHGCYDQGNFIGNYKKAQRDGFMREQPTEKGARVRRYMLTQKGMTEAGTLLRELVLQ